MCITVFINHRTVKQKSKAQSALNIQTQKRKTKHFVMLPCVPLAVVQQNRATSYRHINKKTPKPSNCVLKKEKKKRDLWKSNALTVVSGALSVLGGLAPGLRSDETNVWNETSYHVSLNTAHVCNNQHCLGSGATANLHFRL